MTFLKDSRKIFKRNTQLGSITSCLQHLHTLFTLHQQHNKILGCHTLKDPNIIVLSETFTSVFVLYSLITIMS